MARVAPQAAIEAGLRDDPEIKRCVLLVAEAVANEARTIAPRGESPNRYQHGLPLAGAGTTAAAIFAEKTSFGARARSPVPWSVFLEHGTGEGVPGGSAVVAKPEKPMVFFATAKTGRRIGRRQKFVLKSHKGMKPQPFMSTAGKAVAASSPGLTWKPIPDWKRSGP